ncbi:MAG: phytoene desaturase [Longilinea sp.]|nr:phytoene desaturase [Longilinea sp.]
MKSVIVIGSGMGGLAVALRLRRMGFAVTVLEKRSRPGGRSYVIEEDGYRVDTGPTILVMKEQFEQLYRDLGRDLHQRLQLTQLDPNYRLYFHDGRTLDLYPNMARLAQAVEAFEPGAGEKVFDFLGNNARKYALGMPFVTRNFDHLTDLANPIAGYRLFATAAHENLYRQVARYFQSDALRKAFSFHSMFLGLSPYESPAIYALITYADLARGMYFPQGGIYRIIEDLVTMAQEDGVVLRTSAPVAQILVENGRAVGVRLESGEELRADAVVSNADLPYTYRKLVPAGVRRDYSDRRLQRMKYACSGFLLYLGLDRTYPQLTHQALYFAEDYRANLDAIFVTGELPADPSFHLNCPTRSDPALAPEGHELLYVLAPMPSLEKGRVDWSRAAETVREQLLSRLEQVVDRDIRKHIVWERRYTPVDFERDLNAVYGTAFGSLAHNFFQSAYFRPHNVARALPGLYFVGQGTYPGIGMPMVMISAQLTAERLRTL